MPSLLPEGTEADGSLGARSCGLGAPAGFRQPEQACFKHGDVAAGARAQSCPAWPALGTGAETCHPAGGRECVTAHAPTWSNACYLPEHPSSSHVMLGWGRALEEDKRAGAGETRLATRAGALQRQTSWAPSAARSRQEPRAFTPEAGSPDTLRDGN